MPDRENVSDAFECCWNCEHCHDGGALSGWFCDIHGSLNHCNKFVYKCKAWTEKHEYQIDASDVT